MGDFQDANDVQSSVNIDIEDLNANHEEADTRVILHALHTTADNIVVHARNTDILVLLIAHSNRFGCDKVWLKTGTSTNRKYIPVKDVANKYTNKFCSPIFDSIPQSHRLRHNLFYQWP